MNKLEDRTETAPIVITMGDPAGVGAEVIVKAAAELPTEIRRQFVVVGSAEIMERAIAATGVSLKLASRDGAAPTDALRIDNVDIDGLPIAFGKLDPAAGEASFRFIAHAVKLVQSGQSSGLVTAPINKAALNMAGHHYDGHTGMLAHLTGSPSSFMLLASERLNVIHVSTHISLKDAIDRATPQRIADTIRAGDRHLRRLGLTHPRIAVAGINPHCGEDGLFGVD